MRESFEQSLADPGASEHGSRPLQRVARDIAPTVLAFCRLRLFDSFHLDELNKYVAERVGTIAPDSPGRILRMLKRADRVDYQVTNRAQSKYCITRVEN
jgi:hypothetical protein